MDKITNMFTESSYNASIKPLISKLCCHPTKYQLESSVHLLCIVKIYEQKLEIFSSHFAMNMSMDMYQKLDTNGCFVLYHVGEKAT